jgi:hypothetical protein
MAIDTLNKRGSALGFCKPFARILPDPGSYVNNSLTRAQLANLYPEPLTIVLAANIGLSLGESGNLHVAVGLVGNIGLLLGESGNAAVAKHLQGNIGYSLAESGTTKLVIPLRGNVGLGLGLHPNISVGVPLSGDIKLTLGLRSTPFSPHVFVFGPYCDCLGIVAYNPNVDVGMIYSPGQIITQQDPSVPPLDPGMVYLPGQGLGLVPVTCEECVT